MSNIDPWNRCDACGKFIAIDDFDNGALRRCYIPHCMVGVPDEDYENLCIKCNTKENRLDK